MEKIEKMLLLSAVIGFAVMFIWMGMIIFGAEGIYSFNSNLWKMDQFFSKEFFYTANLVGIGMWKMAVILFFAIPWLAMKIVFGNS
ncbi:MAG: DUF6868 family protein [Planctomycetota bacterium]|jgi:hypothetical protein